MTRPERAHLCVVVCVNGLGHFKRALDVLDHLRRTCGDAHLHADVYADRWQVERIRHWPSLSHLAEATFIRFHHGVMDGSPRWDSMSWVGSAYFEWIERLASQGPLQRADVVLSDNLVGVLSVRPDAVLMGSFLWHDVLRDRRRGIAQVVSFEEQLLLRTRPAMLCVGDIVMPAVERSTRAMRLPWFCEEARASARDAWPLRRIVLAGGATRSASSALHQLARVLEQRTDLALSVPSQLIGDDLRTSARVRGFEWPDAEFAAGSLAIGRPGAGTLTDCIRHGIPILCFADEDNDEIRHNARCVEKLAFGQRISMSDPDATVHVLERLTRGQYASWKRNVSARPRGGSAQAAHLLARRLNLTEPHA